MYKCSKCGLYFCPEWNELVVHIVNNQETINDKNDETTTPSQCTSSTDQQQKNDKTIVVHIANNQHKQLTSSSVAVPEGAPDPKIPNPDDPASTVLLVQSG